MALRDIVKDIKGGLEVFTDKEARREAAIGISQKIAPLIPKETRIERGVREFFEPTERVRIRDIVREIPTTLGKGAELVKEAVVEFPLRALTSLTVGAIQEIKTPGVHQVVTPRGELQQVFLGEKEIKSVQARAKEIQESMRSFGVPSAGVAVFPVLAVGALTGLDLAPFGGSKKSLIQQLRKTNVVEDAFGLLKQAGVTDDLARIYSSAFAKTKKIGDVERGVHGLENVIRTTRRAVDTVSPSLRTISDVPNAPSIFKLADVGAKEIADVPKTAMGDIKREISRIRGERLAGTIDAKVADEIVQSLNKELVKEAKHQGIAVIGGTPIIRRSGVFAPKEFADYPFKDLKGKALSLNLDDAVLQIDNKKFADIAKEGLGPMAELQYRKSQATAALIEFGEKQSDSVLTILKRFKIKPTKKNGIQAMLAAHGLTNDLIKAKGTRKAIIEVLKKADISDEAIVQALRPGFLTRLRRGESAVVKAVKDGIPENIDNAVKAGLRPHLDEMLEQANKVRAELGKDLINRRENYGPVVQNTNFWSKLRSEPKTTITDNFDFVIPNAKKNPHALPRKAGAKDIEWNLWESLPRYHEAIAQDIFHAPIIEQLKAVNRALKLRGFDGTVNFINRNIRENIVGQSGLLDSFFGLTNQTKTRAWLNTINRARMTAALSFNIIWSTFVQPASLILTVARAAGTGKGAAGLVLGPVDFAKGTIKFFTSKVRRAKVNKLPTTRIKTAGKSIGRTGLGDLDALGNKIMKTKWDTLDDYLALYADTMEYTLTGMSSSVGYEMAARAGAKGKTADFIADWMGGATQSRYNREARPLILNNLLVRSNFPFNTYLYELYRLNKSIIGKQGALPLGGWERVNTAVALLGGMYAYDKFVIEPAIGRQLTRPSTFIPLLGNEFEQLLNEGIEATGLADKEIPVIGPALRGLQEETQQFGFRPSGALLSDVHNVVRAFDSYIRHANIQPLRKEMTKWGMGFRGIGGATTLNRFIDGLIANAKEFQTSRAGEKLFRIEGIDKYLSPLVGPYSTRAGISYFQEGGSIIVQDARREKARQDKMSSEEARERFNEIARQNPELARQVSTLYEDEANPILAKVRGLGIKNGMRAEAIWQEMEKLSPEQKGEEYQKLIDAGVITQEVNNQYTKLLEEQRQASLGERPNLADGEPRSDRGLISTIWLYAQAIGTDPIDALDKILAGEKLRRIDNGAIIVFRFGTEDPLEQLERSQEIREQRATEAELKDLRLDHTIPLQLGGTNKESNLILVSTEEWEGYTPIENLLGDHLRKGTISKKEAQKLIKDFKEGKISAEEIMRRFPPTGEGTFEEFSQ